MKRDSYWPVPHPFLTKHVLLELFRNDEVLANKEMDRFTANRVHQKSSENDSEYELFSDRCQRLYSHYDVDERLVFKPKPDTPTVNLKKLKEILLSKDLSRDKELDWMEA